MRSHKIKRLLDLVGAISGLILLSPVMCLLACLICLKLRTPILFRHPRAGLEGKPFVMNKFRSMLDLSDEQGKPLADDLRLTSFGKFIRLTSLDELPELFNVIKGDMSLVGPRPLLLEYVERYTPEQARRLNMKPGITGWAQINGRNALPWDEKLKLDIWYLDHWSFWLDIKIIFLTILRVLRHEGISAKGYATMPEFRGRGEKI